MNSKCHLLFLLILTVLPLSFLLRANEYTYAEDDLGRIVFSSSQRPCANSSAFSTTIYLRINTTQIFTELYELYGFSNPPKKNIFEQAFYLNQTGVPSPFPLQPDVQAILNRADCILSAFHTRSKNLELYKDPMATKSFFYIANGSFQIMNALVYALVKTFPQQQFVFTEQIPYYAGHQTVVSLLFNYPNARWQPFHDPAEIHVMPNETLVEFVTSPNNPDGKFRKPLTNAAIIIADLVFASSAYGDGTGYLTQNLAWINQARAEGKQVFSYNSASKQFGKTGSRCGYIWYPLDDSLAATIFPHFFNFISFSTLGGGSAGLELFLDLISAFLKTKDNGEVVRCAAHKSIVKRHKLVECALKKRYPGTKVTSVPGSPALFAQLSDKRIPPMSAFDVLFSDTGTAGISGVSAGESPSFIRLNLTGPSDELAEFLNRLSGTKKYKPSQLLVKC